MRVPFKRPIGIELTFVPKDPDPWHLNSRNYMYGSTSPTRRSWSQLSQLYRFYAHEAGITKGSVHADYGCVEFSSPILRSWERTSQWYADAMGIAELAHVTPYEETQEGGCGHIHMGSVDEKLRRKFFIEVWKRPWLSWAFVSPNVNVYAQSLDRVLEANYDGYSRYVPTITLGYDSYGNRTLGHVDNHISLGPHYRMLRYLQTYENRVIQKEFSKLNGCHVKEVQDGYEGFYTAIDASALRHVFNGIFAWKRVITRVTDQTVEWRAFDSAASWEEQEAAVSFYQRFMDWTDNLPKKENDGRFRTEYLKAKKAGITLAPGAFRAVFRNDMALCIKSFKELIVDQLELPWDNYEWLIDVNLKPAFAWGARL